VLAGLGVARPLGKSGAREATTLVLVVGDAQGAREAALAGEYAQRVEARSHGSLRVQVTATPSTDGNDPATALEQLRSGKADLAIAPSEAFSAVHVTTLDALRTPFLIGTDELAARATGPRLAARLMSGLETASLVGLGLVPESLYRPFGFLKPLSSPADFAGVTVRAPRTQAIRELLRTLGAKPVDLEAAGTDTAVYPGFGLDTPGRKSSDAFPENTYTASNVALFPKVDVIVASAAAVRRLTSTERETLRQAANDVRAEAVARNESHAARAAFCRAGGSIVEASSTEVQALRAHTEVLSRALEQNPTTRDLVREIRRFGDGSGGSCASSRPTVLTEPEGNVSNAVRDRVLPPPGSYRAAFTAGELRDAGASAAAAELDVGVLTLTFWGPRYNLRFALEWQGSGRATCRGSAFWPNGLVELDWYPATPCSGYAAFRWQRDGPDLRITAVGDGADARWKRIFRPATWKRVDCAAFLAENGIEPGRTRPCPGGAERQALTRTGRSAAAIAQDGKQLALETSLPDADGIVIGKPDGSELRWLTYIRHGGSWLLDDAWPVFSPDGTWIAFLRARWREGKPWGTSGIAVFVIRTDGSSLERLTPFARWDRLPRSIRLPFRDAPLYTLELDGTRLTWTRASEAGDR
jgi:TRAP-type C4-dicarboxylate transport system substrate-binding protein